MSDPISPDEPERRIHNGEIQSDIPGVITEFAPVHRTQTSQTVEDINPEQLAGLMAGVISAALGDEVPVSPMEIVNRLLRLKTARGHKVVWTRFDVNQLFALWTNKLDRQRIAR